MGCWDWGRYLVGSLAEGRFVGVVALGRGGQPGLVSSMIWCLFGFLSLVVYLAIYFFSSFVFGSFGCGRDYGFVPCASLRYRSQLYLKYWRTRRFCMSSAFFVACEIGLSYIVSRCMLLYS